MRPECINCGNYILPCLHTANGIHPMVVDKTSNKVVSIGRNWVGYKRFAVVPWS